MLRAPPMTFQAYRQTMKLCVAMFGRVFQRLFSAAPPKAQWAAQRTVSPAESRNVQFELLSQSLRRAARLAYIV